MMGLPFVRRLLSLSDYAIVVSTFADGAIVARAPIHSGDTFGARKISFAVCEPLIYANQ